MLHDWSVPVEDCAYPVRTLSKLIWVVIDRCLAVVDGCLIHHDGIFSCIEHLRFAPDILPAVREIIRNCCLACLTFLCGDQHDTVRCTCTINGSRSSILEDFYTLDVTRVEVVDTTGNCKTVHNIKRSGVMDGADTTDTDL